MKETGTWKRETEIFHQVVCSHTCLQQPELGQVRDRKAGNQPESPTWIARTLPPPRVHVSRKLESQVQQRLEPKDSNNGIRTSQGVSKQCLPSSHPELKRVLMGRTSISPQSIWRLDSGFCPSVPEVTLPHCPRSWFPDASYCITADSPKACQRRDRKITTWKLWHCSFKVLTEKGPKLIHAIICWDIQNPN